MVHLLPRVITTKVVRRNDCSLVAHVMRHPKGGLLVRFFDEEGFLRMHRRYSEAMTPEDKLLKHIMGEFTLSSISEVVSAADFVVGEVHVESVPVEHRWVLDDYRSARDAERKKAFKQWLDALCVSTVAFKRAEPGATANACACHDPCLRTARAKHTRG